MIKIDIHYRDISIRTWHPHTPYRYMFSMWEHLVYFIGRIMLQKYILPFGHIITQTDQFVLKNYKNYINRENQHLLMPTKFFLYMKQCRLIMCSRREEMMYLQVTFMKRKRRFVSRHLKKKKDQANNIIIRGKGLMVSGGVGRGKLSYSFLKGQSRDGYFKHLHQGFLNEMFQRPPI